MDGGVGTRGRATPLRVGTLRSFSSNEFQLSMILESSLFQLPLYLSERPSRLRQSLQSFLHPTVQPQSFR